MSTFATFQGKPPGETADQVAKGTVFEPNPLAKLEQPSYHIKFYLGDDLGLDINPRFVIAETGLTAFNITDFEIDAKVAPNHSVKNIMGTALTLTIIEPLGMSLPDKIIAAASRSTIQNFMQAPYYISVDFLGYDTDSGAVLKPLSKSWVWRVMITDLKTDLDVTGGKHTISFVAYNDVGTFDQFSNIRTTIQVDVSKKEGKIGDVMKGLEEQINNGLKKSYNVAGGGKVPFIIEIKDVPYKESNDGVKRPFDHKIIRNQKHLDSSRNQEIVQISRGTDIGRLVDYLMSVSETATKMLNPASSGTETNGASKEFSTMHRVDVTLENINYDTKSQDYVRKITFWIRPHDSVRPLSSTSGTDAALAQGKAKYNFIRSNNYLKKEYQYIFTGENTEVLDFNISLNFNFAVAQSLGMGYLTTETASPGRQLEPLAFHKQANNAGWSKTSDADPPLKACLVPPGSAGSTTQAGALLESLTNYNDIDSLGIGRSYLPVAFVQDGNDPRYHVNQAVEGTNDRTRSVYGSILNQLYNTRDSNLGDLSIVVRGDPYWLGVTNTEDLETPTSNLGANYTFGDQSVLVKFMIPQGIDEEGNPKLVLTDSYSGFYSIDKVISKFSQGQFTQTLQGPRINTMMVSELLGGK